MLAQGNSARHGQPSSAVRGPAPGSVLWPGEQVGAHLGARSRPRSPCRSPAVGGGRSALRLQEALMALDEFGGSGEQRKPVFTRGVSLMPSLPIHLRRAIAQCEDLKIFYGKGWQTELTLELRNWHSPRHEDGMRSVRPDHRLFVLRRAAAARGEQYYSIPHVNSSSKVIYAL